MLNLYASQEHYAEHMWPIWEQIPLDQIGRAVAPRAGCWWGAPPDGRPLPAGPVMVASYGDAVNGMLRGRDLVYVEHGAGQTYDGDPMGFGAAGHPGTTARGLDRVRVFVCPNETVANRWRAVHPEAVAVAVGCPKLDRYHRGDVARATAGTPTVAISFHWDCSLVPETRSAWPAYDPVLPDVAAWADQQGVRLLGHGHPRLWPQISRRWQALGIEPVQHLADVLETADVFAADNTSAMFEAASIGMPVLALDAPWYRHHVEHGLRFWSHVPGLQVAGAGDLIQALEFQLRDLSAGSELRAEAAAAAYAHQDGHAAERAAQAIMETL